MNNIEKPLADSPGDADRIKRLEHIVEELKLRESHEDGRQNTADTKLTGTLAFLPIIVGLATTAFFEMLPLAAKTGQFGVMATFGFLIAVVLFLIAAGCAINGLWPTRNRYTVPGLRTILKFQHEGTYEQQLAKMIDERSDGLRSNGAVNVRKLNLYMLSQRWLFGGLCLLTLFAFLWGWVYLKVRMPLLGPAKARVTQPNFPNHWRSKPHTQLDSANYDG